MIKRTITATVGGYKYIQDSNKQNVAIQFQSLFYNEEKQKFEQKTVKLHKLLDEKKADNLIDKTLRFDNVDEYVIDNNTYYSSKEFEVIESSEDIFNINKTAEIVLLAVVRQSAKDKADSIVMQTKKKIGKALKLDNFKIKSDVFDEELFNKLSKLIGKKLLLKDINEVHFNNKTFYSTSVAPSIIK